MSEPVFGRDDEVSAFVAGLIPGCDRGFTACAAIGFGTPLVAGVVYHNWNPESGVIELSAASSRRNWLTKRNLALIFGYPFDQLGCQMCVARTDPGNLVVRRIWKTFGAREYVIPRLRGRDKAEVICTLTQEAWQAFIGKNGHG